MEDSGNLSRKKSRKEKNKEQKDINVFGKSRTVKKTKVSQTKKSFRVKRNKEERKERKKKISKFDSNLEVGNSIEQRAPKSLAKIEQIMRTSLDAISNSVKELDHISLQSESNKPGCLFVVYNAEISASSSLKQDIEKNKSVEFDKLHEKKRKLVKNSSKLSVMPEEIEGNKLIEDNNFEENYKSGFGLEEDNVPESGSEKSKKFENELEEEKESEFGSEKSDKFENELEEEKESKFRSEKSDKFENELEEEKESEFGSEKSDKFENELEEEKESEFRSEKSDKFENELEEEKESEFGSEKSDKFKSEFEENKNPKSRPKKVTYKCTSDNDNKSELESDYDRKSKYNPTKIGSQKSKKKLKPKQKPKEKLKKKSQEKSRKKKPNEGKLLGKNNSAKTKNDTKDGKKNTKKKAFDKKEKSKFEEDKQNEPIKLTHKRKAPENKQCEEFDTPSLEIQFPFEPYQIQTSFMEKVVQAIEKEENALLESPTGTGKTLALLCSSLEWQKIRKDPSHRIYYLSRTHLQLKQAIRDLRRTNYKPQIATLGSKSLLCINPKYNKNSNLGRICKDTCKYYKKTLETNVNLSLPDIEDFKDYCQTQGFCPYYSAKAIQKYANITFMPYNYFLDPHIKKTFNENLFHDSIMIFDEGHNVGNAIETLCSFSIEMELLKTCVSDVQILINFFGNKFIEEKYEKKIMKKLRIPRDNQKLMEKIKNNLLNLQASFNNIMNFLKNISSEKIERNLPPSELFDFLVQSTKTENYPGLSETNWMEYYETAYMAVNILSAIKMEEALRKWSRIIQNTFEIVYESALEKEDKKILKGFSLIYCEKFVESGCQISREEWLEQKSNFRSIQVICVNPGVILTKLKYSGVRSIILTSGTLAPLKILEDDLSIKFPIQLENRHVIDQSRVCTQIVTGDEKEQFCFLSKNRKNTEMTEALKKLLRNIIEVTPGGVLCFFTCYTVMYSFSKNWSNSEGKALKEKDVKFFVEQKSNQQNETFLNQYQEHIKSRKKAIFFAVMRGKVSEGLDLKDDSVRTIVIVGIPYAPKESWETKLKQKFKDEFSTPNINGNIWYNQDAIRAVNQSIGRLIRHKNDFGAIVLADKRYSDPSISQFLSKWIADSEIKKSTSFQCISNLQNFFTGIVKEEPPALKHLPTKISISLEDFSATIQKNNFLNLLLNSSGLLEEIKSLFSEENSTQIIKILDQKQEYPEFVPRLVLSIIQNEIRENPSKKTLIQNFYEKFLSLVTSLVNTQLNSSIEQEFSEFKSVQSGSVLREGELKGQTFPKEKEIPNNFKKFYNFKQKRIK